MFEISGFDTVTAEEVMQLRMKIRETAETM